MMDEAAISLSIGQARAALASGSLSATALTEAYLDRIARFDGALRTYVDVHAQVARRRAASRDRAAKSGGRLGALHGIPIAIKDVFDVAGSVTRANSRLLADAPAAKRDSAIVARLRGAGAIVLGKLHAWELSVGGPSTEPPSPPARNPWKLAHSPGGSSSGAGAAVAARLAMAAIGGDTGGSVRLPASACGVVGLRATSGSLPTRGSVPFSWSLDIAGPIARSVADCAAIYSVMSRSVASPPGSLAGIEIGIPRAWLDLAPPDLPVAAALDDAIRRSERAGAKLRDVRIERATDFNAAYFLIARAEAHACWRHELARRPRAIGSIARRSLALGALIDSAALVDAWRCRQLLARGMDRLFKEEVNVLMLPTMPSEAGLLDPADGVTRADDAPYCRPMSLVGVPALSLPWTLGPGGLPIGLQLAARSGSDRFLLAIAAAIEAISPWQQRLPPEDSWN
jgi:aspartyl-tRNA(Asn)/glutamyl-tRNA(Gln) amidotransferase subunit A